MSTRGTNIRKGFKKKIIICGTKPKNCPFLLHSFAEHVSGGIGSNFVLLCIRWALLVL